MTESETEGRKGSAAGLAMRWGSARERFSGVIYGDPVGWTRGRMNTGGKGPVRVFQSDRLSAWYGEAIPQLRKLWEAQRPLTVQVITEDLLALDLCAVFKRPGRLLPDPMVKRSKKVIDPYRLWFGGAPDLDNLRKAFSDALQKAGVIHDDKIIVAGEAVKVYAAIGQSPGVEFRLHAAPPSPPKAFFGLIN